MLHPLLAGPNARIYGPYGDIAEFEAAVLLDPEFENAFLRPADVQTLLDLLGRPVGPEVYYPVPFPVLGGSGELESYDKGNVWVFADLVGQSRGLQ